MLTLKSNHHPFIILKLVWSSKIKTLGLHQLGSNQADALWRHQLRLDSLCERMSSAEVCAATTSRPCRPGAAMQILQGATGGASSSASSAACQVPPWRPLCSAAATKCAVKWMSGAAGLLLRCGWFCAAQPSQIFVCHKLYRGGWVFVWLQHNAVPQFSSVCGVLL